MACQRLRRCRCVAMVVARPPCRPAVRNLRLGAPAGGSSSISLRILRQRWRRLHGPSDGVKSQLAGEGSAELRALPIYGNPTTIVHSLTIWGILVEDRKW